MAIKNNKKNIIAIDFFINSYYNLNLNLKKENIK